jgi:hypothetical protein
LISQIQVWNLERNSGWRLQQVLPLEFQASTNKKKPGALYTESAYMHRRGVPIFQCFFVKRFFFSLFVKCFFGGASLSNFKSIFFKFLIFKRLFFRFSILIFRIPFKDVLQTPIHQTPLNKSQVT